MQRIALISEHASPLAAPGGIDSGGQNVYVAHVARQLTRYGYLIDVYTRRDSSSLPEVLDWYPGVRVIHVPAGPAVPLSKEVLLPHMDAFADFVCTFMRDHQLRYQLAHANFFMSGLVALQMKRTFGVPFVITFHALGRVRRLCQGEADGFPDQRFEIEELLMREAAQVIAECDQDVRDMTTLYQARRKNISIVPCGFDPGEFWPVRASARRRMRLSSSTFLVLQLGRMVPRKGIDNVICALALLREQQGTDAHLMIVGGERPQRDDRDTEDSDVGNSTSEAADRLSAALAERQRLAALARALGVEDRVSFPGPQPREALREFYSAADVFVTTPWYEPFGITPLEAMACATPVIGSDVGGIRSTVVSGQTGYLVPPRDPLALASRLAVLCKDPQLARRMGWNGLRRAHRHFTWQRVAEQLAGVYESIGRDAMQRVLIGLGASETLDTDGGRTEDNAWAVAGFVHATRAGANSGSAP